MALLEDHTAAFIVRIWLESAEAPGSHGEWRGSIEHVMSGRRAFFRDLGAIATFMRPHLDDIGIDAASSFWERMSSDDPEFDDAGELSVAAPAMQPARRKRARRR